MVDVGGGVKNQNSFPIKVEGRGTKSGELHTTHHVYPSQVCCLLPTGLLEASSEG